MKVLVRLNHGEVEEYDDWRVAWERFYDSEDCYKISWQSPNGKHVRILKAGDRHRLHMRFVEDACEEFKDKRGRKTWKGGNDAVNGFSHGGVDSNHGVSRLASSLGLVPPTAARTVPRVKRPRGIRLCSNCLKPGHYRSTCKKEKRDGV